MILINENGQHLLQSTIKAFNHTIRLKMVRRITGILLFLGVNRSWNIIMIQTPSLGLYECGYVLQICIWILLLMSATCCIGYFPIQVFVYFQHMFGTTDTSGLCQPTYKASRSDIFYGLHSFSRAR